MFLLTALLAATVAGPIGYWLASKKLNTELTEKDKTISNLHELVVKNQKSFDDTNEELTSHQLSLKVGLSKVRRKFGKEVHDAVREELSE